MVQTESPALEPGRSETFPYPEILARGASPIGPICYFDVGTETHLPPILLIHALGTNMTHWEYVAPELAQHTRVIGLDLPGCGHSARPRRRYTQKEMSDAVVGLMDHLHIQRAVVLGHSFGGKVAADVALRFPDRVVGLVLMNSSGFQRHPPGLRQLGRIFFRPQFVAPLMIRGVDKVLGRIFSSKSERTERFIHQVVSRPDPRFAYEFAHYACPMLPDLMSNFLDRLHELTMPALVIWGTDDALLRYDGVAAWVQRMPDASLIPLHGCGHMPNLEQPEEVSRALLNFLPRVARRINWRQAQAV